MTFHFVPLWQFDNSPYGLLEILESACIAIDMTLGRKIKSNAHFALALAATPKDGRLPAGALPGNRELSIFRPAINPKAPFCHYCELEFTTLEACAKHFDDEHPDAWRCSATECGLKFNSPQELLQHTQSEY